MTTVQADAEPYVRTGQIKIHSPRTSRACAAPAGSRPSASTC